MSLILDIEKQLGDFHLRINTACADEVLSLLGASGSGKSVALKCIAGIIRPDRGRIVINDRVVFDSEKGINLPVQKRRAGLLFQNYALFPNMTVLQNILTGTKRDGGGSEEATRLIEQFGLSEVMHLYPSQISGGQQQRTALARLLVSKPDILLLDEPFSALDSHLRFRMEEELRAVIRSFAGTVVLVTHNRDEAFRLSDQVAVLLRGQVERYGSKDEVFRNPQSVEAARLTGCKNISPVRIIDANHIEATDWGLEFCTDDIPEDLAYVGVRMHFIFPGPGENSFLCDVTEEIENPFSYTVMLKKQGATEEEKSFGWEIDKDTWGKNRARQITVHIPRTSLHFLRGNRTDGKREDRR